MKILLVTVGGSHQPILTSCQQNKPDRTIFICSSGQKSSTIQITGKGKVIKENVKDPKPSLSNIPTQLGLAPDTFEVLEVEPDSLEQSALAIKEKISSTRKVYPSADLIADYTGGTKTMSAGLVVAALGSGIGLHLVTGNRSDLIKVSDGTQWGFQASTDRLRFLERLEGALRLWDDFAYGMTVNALEKLTPPGDDSRLRDRFFAARTLSKALDAWDRFDHVNARKFLNDSRSQPGVAAEFKDCFGVLNLLVNEGPKQEPARIHDLWLNALRRAHQNSFDDAVSRAYRILEWVGQWALNTECGIEASDVPADKIPEGMMLFPGADGKVKAPLYKVWELVAFHGRGPCAQWAQSNIRDLNTHLGTRNESILAHGFKPIEESKWREMQTWIEDRLLPPFFEQATRTGIRTWSDQLPRVCGSVCRL